MRAEGEGAEKGWEQLLSKVEHKVLSNRALGYRLRSNARPSGLGQATFSRLQTPTDWW